MKMKMLVGLFVCKLMQNYIGEGRLRPAYVNRCVINPIFSKTFGFHPLLIQFNLNKEMLIFSAWPP